MLNGTGKMNFSIIVFIAVFAIILISFLGLKFGSLSIDKKNNELKIQITSESGALSGKQSVDDVIDTQTRLKEVKNNLGAKIEVNSVLSDISKVVIPGIVFSSYTQTDKKVLITLRTSNFDSVSKQVFNFKQADFASSVNVKSLSRDTKGIKCDVEINIK